MNRILTIIAVLLGIGWMVAGRGNKAADKPANEYENKDVDRDPPLTLAGSKRPTRCCGRLSGATNGSREPALRS